MDKKEITKFGVTVLLSGERTPTPDLERMLAKLSDSLLEIEAGEASPSLVVYGDNCLGCVLWPYNGAKITRIKIPDGITLTDHAPPGEGPYKVMDYGDQKYTIKVD